MGAMATSHSLSPPWAEATGGGNVPAVRDSPSPFVTYGSTRIGSPQLSSRDSPRARVQNERWADYYKRIAVESPSAENLKRMLNESPRQSSRALSPTVAYSWLRDGASDGA